MSDAAVQALRAGIEPLDAATAAALHAAVRAPVLVWCGGGVAQRDAAAAALATPTFAALLRDAGATRLAITTDADADATLAARDDREAMAIAVALASDGCDALGVVALDDAAATRAVVAALCEGAAAVRVPVLHDGAITAQGVAAALARCPALAGYLRPAQGPVDAALASRIGGPPGGAIALAWIAARRSSHLNK